MYKKTVKPTWSKPFINQSIAVATWTIFGTKYHEMIDSDPGNTIYGWAYEPKGE